MRAPESGPLSRPAPLVVCLAGLSNSGKTCLAERLVPILAARGLRVGYLKANAHRIDLDREGKDTDRLRRAGAKSVAIHSAEGAVHFPAGVGPRLPRHIDPNVPALSLASPPSADREAFDHSVRARLWNLRPLYRECDLILIEGMKASALPKLVINRDDHPRGRLDPQSLRGVVDEIRFSRMPVDAEWAPHLERALGRVEELLDAAARRQVRGLTGAILAGGGSTRMGRDKARFPIPGWPAESDDLPIAGTWLERAFLLLAERMASCWIVGRITTAGDDSLPLLTADVRSHLDLARGEGPLCGLATALAIADGSVLVMPCDLPLLAPRALDVLLERRAAFGHAGRDVPLVTAFRRADGRLEPAVAIVEADARPHLEAYLAAGGRKVQSFFGELGADWVDLPADLSPGFRNMNRPDDLSGGATGVT